MTDSLTATMPGAADDQDPGGRFSLPNIALPQGGGAIGGLDERFAVNGANGTATFTLPLPVAGARGSEPPLTLTYTSLR